MKTLVAFASKYGTTKRCAQSIADRITGGADVIDIRRSRSISFDDYDAVVIGGPIYAGRVMNAVPAFCNRHRKALLDRTVGLFVCCLYDGENALSELDEAFPAWLNAHALLRTAVGGAIELARLGPVDRYLVRKVARVNGDIKTVKDEELSAVASAINDHRTSSTRSPNTKGR